MMAIRMTFRSTALLLLLPVVLAACAANTSNPIQSEPGKFQEGEGLAPHTGSLDFEYQFAALPPEKIQNGLQVFVSADRLNARTSPDSSGQIAGVLEFNDRVEIVTATEIGADRFIAIRVIKSNSAIPKDKTYYVSAKYLNETPTQRSEERQNASKYFVVTNIATEKIRVYRRCEAGEGCVNKMVFEQDVVNGEDSDGTRTDVGSFHISSWEKLYETSNNLYPAWYRPHYPPVPGIGANLQDWFSKDYMPNGRGDMRGAFGWYTAKVAPNPRAQWLHGTAGWGADGKRFILFKKTLKGRLLDLFMAIRSHGCTRIDNESIAYLRSLLPVGTPYIKIYAREGYRDEKRSGYDHKYKANNWLYIMTTKDYGKTNHHQLAERQAVLRDGTPQSQWIEEGLTLVDTFPDAFKGDLYGIGKRGFRGVFLVDEGTTVDYQHPSSGMKVGGYPDGKLPSFMIARGTNLYQSIYTVPFELETESVEDIEIEQY